MTERDKPGFAVWVPMEFRAKVERLARGSMRSLGSAVAKLISDADAEAPEWNLVPQETPNSGNGEENHDEG